MRTESIYCIKDNNGRFEGRINICSNSLTKPNSNWKWDYISYEIPVFGNLIRENAEMKVSRLKELNLLAEFNLDWEVAEFTEQEFKDFTFARYCVGSRKCSSSSRDNMSIETKDIQRGCICKHRKAVRDIYRKHKYIENMVH